MSTLADTDASLASGAPSLPVAEPSLLLLTLAARTLAAVVGDADALDTSGSCRGLVLVRVEAGVSCDQAGDASRHCRMYLDRRDQQIRVRRPSCIHFVVNDDLVLCLLQLYQLAKFCGLGRLALTDHLGRWLEDLAHAPSIAPVDAGLALTKNLLNPRHHGVEHPAMTFERHLLDHLRTALHAIADFPREAFRLCDHTAGRPQQAAVCRFQLVPAGRGLSLRGPSNLQNPPLHAAAPIAQLRASCASHAGDVAHTARQYPDAIT